MTSTPPASGVTRHLRVEDVQPLIEAARPGTVTVIAAPPGSGKSTAMYHALGHRMAARYQGFDPRPFRVLWATQGTQKDLSLGKEAYAELVRAQLALGVPSSTRMLEAVDRVTGMDRYRAQFDWSHDPSATARVISHAHLPVLMAQDAPGFMQDFMRDVDLVVVDEDPLFSLLFSLDSTGRFLTLPKLQGRRDAGAAGPVELAILDLMEAALNATSAARGVLKVTHPISEKETFSVTGRAFWEHLRSGMSEIPDWPAFVEALARETFTKRLPDTLRRALATALEQDWNAAVNSGQYSNRFGITWQSADPRTMQFRADILRELRPDTPPIIVLDAYADARNGQYQRAFPNHAVQVVHPLPVVPLDIEIRPDLHLDRTNLTHSRQRPRRKHVLAEVGRLTGSSNAGSLVLTYKKVVQYLSQPALQAEWRRDAPMLIQDVKQGKRSIEFAHWFAGRGVNTFTGRHVVALHPPARPSLFEHHSLAALVPYEAAEREQLAGHLRDTELLQMLHRGRQTTIEPGTPHRPRVILAFNPDGDLGDWAQIRQGFAERPVRPNTTNLHHQRALDVLASELVTLLGAVPHVCLSALGLYTPSRTEEPQVAKAGSALLRLSRHKKRRAPVLDAWDGTNESLTDKLSPFTALAGDKPKRVLEAMARRPALAAFQRFDVTTSWPGGTTRVYAADQTSAELAVERLRGRT